MKTKGKQKKDKNMLNYAIWHNEIVSFEITGMKSTELQPIDKMPSSHESILLEITKILEIACNLHINPMRKKTLGNNSHEGNTSDARTAFKGLETF